MLQTHNYLEEFAKVECTNHNKTKHYIYKNKVTPLFSIDGLGWQVHFYFKYIIFSRVHTLALVMVIIIISSLLLLLLFCDLI